MSLAKREEEVFLPGRAEPLAAVAAEPLASSCCSAPATRRIASPSAYSRNRRAKRTITSELLTIPGVGPNRRRALLERFGSLAGVRTATRDEIAALPGFSHRLASGSSTDWSVD